MSKEQIINDIIYLTIFKEPDKMFTIIWEFIINMLESSLFAIIANTKCQKRAYRYSMLKQFTFLSFKSLLITILNIKNVSTIITIILVLLLNCIFISAFFTNTLFNSFFISFFFSLALIISDALTTLIPSTIFCINLTQLLYTGNMRIPFALIYISVVGLFVIIYLLFSPKVFILGNFDKISFFILSCICTVLEELILIALLEQPKQDTLFSKLLLFIFGLSIFLFIYISIYVYRLGKEKEKNAKLVEEITIAKMETKQNEEIINSTRNLRILKHDIMNHMCVLYNLIEAKENDKALQYLSQINNSIEKTSYTISTGFTSIDCIMTSKLSTAFNNNIEIEHQIHFPSAMDISDMDLCSLLGNLLDNAIEANCKLNEEKRKLQIVIKPYNNMLSIYVSNNCNGNYYYNNVDGSLLTSKNQNRNEHGIGIKRIIEIIKKYDGIIDINPEDNIFSVSILLPITK